MNAIFTRRGLIATTAIAGVGFAVGCRPTGSEAAAGIEFNPFVLIGKDNTVTVLLKHIEFGQGTATGLSTIIAEELDADWSQMRFDHAPANAEIYWNRAFGDAFKVQGTGGSTAIANSWPVYREAGAAARAMLVAAAAQKFGVKPEEVTVEKGVLKAGDKSATFGEVAEAAAKIAPPTGEALKLKDPSQFKLIGQPKAPRLDGAPKTNGTAVYTQDFKRPGMLTAVMLRSPKFGGVVKSVDDAAAKAVAGVVAVVQAPRGVAVVADNTWAAMKGRDALKVEWDFSKAETRSTAQITADFKAEFAKPGVPVRTPEASEKPPTGARLIRATYEFPYLAHAMMETLDAVVEYKPGRSLDIWAGSQMPSVDRFVGAQMTKLKEDQVKVHTLIAGGSFGRRATPDNDVVAEAISIAMAMNGKAPIKLVWTREDDITGGRYRPLVVHQVEAGVDRAGRLAVWRHKVIGQPILLGTPFAPPDAKFDYATVGGLVDTKYQIPNFSLEAYAAQSGVPVLWWRSVEHTHTAYVMETMLDELARSAGKDPVAFRKSLLKPEERHVAALDLAVAKAGPAPKGRGKGRGVAVHESFGSVVAQVVDVTVGANGLTVDKVTCAVDCGIALNPDMVTAQMEGGIGYGLSSILGEAVTLTDGAPDQKNFDTYTVMRMSQAPKAIEVHIVPSANPPTGVGEPGTPPIGPALANAVHAATGKRIRSLPFGSQVVGA
jgi:isoquinoline 1-oxidoreductase beta subunit